MKYLNELYLLTKLQKCFEICFEVNPIKTSECKKKVSLWGANGVFFNWFWTRPTHQLTYPTQLVSQYKKYPCASWYFMWNYSPNGQNLWKWEQKPYDQSELLRFSMYYSDYPTFETLGEMCVCGFFLGSESYVHIEYQNVHI